MRRSELQRAEQGEIRRMGWRAVFGNDLVKWYDPILIFISTQRHRGFHIKHTHPLARALRYVWTAGDRLLRWRGQDWIMLMVGVGVIVALYCYGRYVR